MTALAKRKTRLTFETAALANFKGSKLRAVIFEADNPFSCSVRLKGSKTRYPVSYVSIYNLAVKQQVERRRQERKAR